ncbi:hypothetical protein MTR_3g450420 [Medicago truncatula]|uniref:Uncharacterized protein n=1 Tax=Medicago truncatula TaxID=3880 RepID=A0A072UVK6_MEDTR|nr:hypothetical protein MTR_3g450420 [Medicago truncatula]
MKFISLVLYKQLAHLLLMHQGTTKEEEKASITTLESTSNQRFLQPLSTAISMAVMAAQKALSTLFVFINICGVSLSNMYHTNMFSCV